MSIRKLHWFESRDDAVNIRNNGWNLQLAKAVKSGSAATTYNLIWGSQALAPDTSISWKAEYGLNWTAQVPNDGKSISIGGEWQACNKGQSFDIDSLGYWRASARPVPAERADWLNVGNIEYSYPGVLGLHIVVGVRNAISGDFEPIFVDKATLPPGSSGWYQPQETVSWWLESGDHTGEIFSRTKSESATYDFSNPSDPVTNSYVWSTSYLFNPHASANPSDPPKHWIIAPGAPPQSRSAPPPFALLAPLSLGGHAPMAMELDPARWIITFDRTMSAAVLSAAAACLYFKLKIKFTKVEISIEGTDGTKLRVVYEAGNGNPSGNFAFLDTTVGSASGPGATIDKALRDMLTSGNIPAGETWDISPDATPSPLATMTSSSNSILPVNTALAGYNSQAVEPVASDKTFPDFQQLQQQPNRQPTMPSIASIRNSVSGSPSIIEQPAEYISQTTEPNKNDTTSYGFPQPQQQSNGEVVIPTHFNDDNPNGVQLITV